MHDYCVNPQLNLFEIAADFSNYHVYLSDSAPMYCEAMCVAGTACVKTKYSRIVITDNFKVTLHVVITHEVI